MKRLLSFLLLICLLVLLISSCNQGTDSESPENNPPPAPAYPHPEDGEDSVSIYAFLSWSHAEPYAGALTYDVYLGPSADPPLVSSNLETKFYFSEPMLDNTAYFWKIVVRDNQGQTSDGPLWQFHTYAEPGNNVPDVPSDPFPEHNATGIAPGVTFTWSCSDPDSDALRYHLYWGTSENLLNFVRDLDTAAYAMWAITLNYHHYWKVIAEDEHGAATEGPIWEFDAALGGGEENHPPEVPDNPSPPVGATEVDPINVILSWTCYDPDQDPLSFDIYFGTFFNPALIESGYHNTYFLVGSLGYNTTYYWNVIANDNHEHQVSGPIWNFTTKVDQPDYPDSIIYEGQTYHTILIGDQCWLKENLNVGTIIDNSANMSDNGIIEKYCYDNDPSNCIVYGGLYQWNEIMNYTEIEGTQGIGPPGWHIPSDADFQTLVDFLGGDLVAGGKMKEAGTIHWNPPNVGATNESGFTALPSGYRYINGQFLAMGDYTAFWTSTPYPTGVTAYVRRLYSSYQSIQHDHAAQNNAFPVRCIMD